MRAVKTHQVKDILDLYFSSYMSDPKRKLFVDDGHLHAVNMIRSCRTLRLGLQVFACEGCADTYHLPRSCKHRFCSTCGAADTHDWADRMLGKLPDIRHHHVVFTVPKPLRHIAKLNTKTFYDLFFRLSNEVIQDFFADRHGLKAGVVSVLHTSGSDLKYHPHIHMIVSGGGLDETGCFQEFTNDYLCPQRVLGKHLRGKLIKELVRLSKIKEEHRDEEGELIYVVKGLELPKRLEEANDFEHWIRKVSPKHWIVNVEKSLPGVKRLISYVGRYTKRSCISEYRLKSIADDEIVFSYKDYKNSKRGEKPVEAEHRMSSTRFLDRLLQHVPEKGFKMVRYYGAYSSGNLSKIPLSQKLSQGAITEEVVLAAEEEEVVHDYSEFRRAVKRRTGKDPLWCECCGRLKKLRQVIYERKNGERYVVEVDTS